MPPPPHLVFTHSFQHANISHPLTQTRMYAQHGLKIPTPRIACADSKWIPFSSTNINQSINQSINPSINQVQGKIQTVQFTIIYKHILFLHDILMIIVIMKTNEPLE